MRSALEPLAALPGVALVALVAEDGVPVAVPGREVVDVEDGNARDEHHVEALAALSAAWVDEVARAVGPLSWEAPERVVLRAARGTLVLRRAHNAWLVLLLSAGLRSEDVMLAMEGAVARVERLVRALGERSEEESGAGEDASPAPQEPSAPLPRHEAPETELRLASLDPDDEHPHGS